MTCHSDSDMDELEASIENGWPYPDKETVSHETQEADEADDEDFWPDSYPNDFAEDDFIDPNPDIY